MATVLSDVSTEPGPVIEPRAAEILDRIKGIFASKGFDRASMQDLARAAGMSAGNFYRYFPSKDAIIAALIQRDLDELQSDFTAILASANLRDALRDSVRQQVEAPLPCNLPIWAEIEAAARRMPEVAALVRRMEAQITENLVAVFARMAGLPLAEAERRHAAKARLIFLLVKGLSMQSGSVAQVPDRELAGLVLQVIDRLLTEIAFGGPTAHDHEMSLSGKIE